MASIRRLEAQLAQEKFFHEKSKAEQQQEIKVKCIEFDSYFSFQFPYHCFIKYGRTEIVSTISHSLKRTASIIREKCNISPHEILTWAYLFKGRLAQTQEFVSICII